MTECLNVIYVYVKCSSFGKTSPSNDTASTKILHCCQITTCFNWTKHSVDFNENWSCLIQRILATHKLNLLAEPRIYASGICSKSVSNLWIKKQKLYNFKYNGHTRTSDITLWRHPLFILDKGRNPRPKQNPRTCREIALRKKLYSNAQSLITLTVD